MDYRTLRESLKKHPNNRTAKHKLAEVEEFLFSERFKAISDINVPYMLKKIDEFVEGDGKKCILVGVS